MTNITVCIIADTTQNKVKALVYRTIMEQDMHAYRSVLLQCNKYCYQKSC